MLMYNNSLCKFIIINFLQFYFEILVMRHLILPIFIFINHTIGRIYVISRLNLDFSLKDKINSFLLG